MCLSACTACTPSPYQWLTMDQSFPPSVERQVLTPPTRRIFASIGEAASARSYQPCPPLPLPSDSHVNKFLVSPLNTRSKVAPLFVDLNIPYKPLSPFDATA